MILLTGHRGVGKTTFLRMTKAANLRSFNDYIFYDLDEEIELRTKKTISEIFQTEGEHRFRQLEQATLKELAQENVMISVGGGCVLDSWKDKARIVWIRRVTDSNGRIFLNRPRLKSEGSEWQESLDLYIERTKLYSQWAHQSWFIPEFLQDLEKLIPLFWQKTDCRFFERGVFTVHPDSHTVLGQCTLELRDDLLSDEPVSYTHLRAHET